MWQFGLTIDSTNSGQKKKYLDCIIFIVTLIEICIQYRSKVSWQSLETRTTRLETGNSKLENLRGEIFESSVSSFESRTLSFEFRVSSKELQVSSRVSRREINELTGPLIVLFPQKKPGKRLHFAAFHWT